MDLSFAECTFKINNYNELSFKKFYTSFDFRTGYCETQITAISL